MDFSKIAKILSLFVCTTLLTAANFPSCNQDAGVVTTDNTDPTEETEGGGTGGEGTGGDGGQSSNCSSPVIGASNSLFTSSLAQPGTVDVPDERSAQSFQFTSAREVESIAVKGGKNMIGNNEILTMEIDVTADCGGNPCSSTLTSGSVPSSSIPQGSYGWVRVTLGTTLSAQANTPYWFVVRYTYLGVGQGALIQATSSGGADWYASGIHKWTINGGVGWATPGGNPDMAFRIYVCN